MRRDTRQEILKAAKELFNERGFNVVSTRDIARALGIGKGNVTYYFKRKEEIVEAILAENPSAPTLKAPKNLEEMNSFFLNIQQVVQENAFYFWHHTQLSQLSPKIRGLQHNIYQSNFEKLTQGFYALQVDGLFREEDFEGEYERMIDTLLLSSIYWMPFCELKQEKISETSFQYQAWSILYSLLTDKGRFVIREIIRI